MPDLHFSWNIINPLFICHNWHQIFFASLKFEQYIYSGHSFLSTKGEKLLQTVNAELARILATAQWNLEVEVC